MECFFRYGVGLLYVLVVSVCLLEVDCIVFEINNMDVNRVIYTFELDIKMTCSEPNITNPQLEILQGSNIVQETQNFKLTRMRQSVELTISQVQLMDGGEYTCRVRSMDSTDIVATSSLTLNVQEGGAYCLYNDSSLNWNEGDTKILSCYYISSFSDDFQWQVSNSSSSFPLMSSSLYTDSLHKRILFVSIGPLKRSDNGNMYQCSHSTVNPADRAASCMFGPISVNPIVATTTQVRAEIIITSRELLSEQLPVTSNSTTHTLEIGSITSVDQSGTSIQSLGVTQVSSKDITATQESSGKDSSVTVFILSSVIVIMAVIIVTGIIYLFVARWKRGERGNTNSDLRSESRMQQKVVSCATLNTTNNIDVGSELRDMKGSHYANKESHVTHHYLNEDVSQQSLYTTKIYNGTMNSCSDGRVTMETIDDGYYELNNPGTVPKS
ncbi:hypothetical protein HOLleu_27953 [Holothuria leucospilota]|uniref:Ig-like domain-containing protein n=1 Tax=Holothuria leucospilota TaxID=206669 RepID=A0A9Q1H356_HOLLE|nr:hypothetical protein HOLleu_27953 [Holothuria leucospilota]